MRLRRSGLGGGAWIFRRRTITSTVPVGGASVGFLNGTTLYVAGSPVPPGTTSTYDAVNVGNMTRITTNSVAIGDGFHTTMALATNNKLYIGANSCSNTTHWLSLGRRCRQQHCRCAVAAAWSDHRLHVRREPQRDVHDRRRLLCTSTTPRTTSCRARRSLFTGALYGIVQVDQ